MVTHVLEAAGGCWRRFIDTMVLCWRTIRTGKDRFRGEKSWLADGCGICDPAGVTAPSVSLYRSNRGAHKPGLRLVKNSTCCSCISVISKYLLTWMRQVATSIVVKVVSLFHCWRLFDFLSLASNLASSDDSVTSLTIIILEYVCRYIHYTHPRLSSKYIECVSHCTLGLMKEHFCILV